MASMAILTSFASIFLPTYSGVRPTISPATNTEMMTNSSMPYMPAPTPPTMISPSWMLISGTMPPRAVEGIMHGVDSAAGGIRGDHGEEARQRNAEAHLLAFHIGWIEPERRKIRVACSLGPEQTMTPARKRTPITARMAQPWR